MGDGWIKSNLINLLDGYGRIYMRNPSRAWFVSFFKVANPIRLTPLTLVFFILDPRVSVFFVLNPGGGGIAFPGSIFISALKLSLFHLLKFFFRVKYLQIGVSSEWPKSRIQLILFRLYASLAGLVGYRDSRSLNIGMRLCSSNAVLFPDLSFASTFQDHQTIEITHSLTKPIYNVAISLSSSCRDKERSIFPYIIANLDASSFVAFAQVLPDIDYNASVSKRLSIKFKNLYVTASAITLETITAFYSSLDLVLSDRLHVLLYAAMCGTPVVPLVSAEMNHKIRSLFGDLGFADILYCCSSSDSKDSIPMFVASRNKQIRDFPKFIHAERPLLHSRMNDLLASYFDKF